MVTASTDVVRLPRRQAYDAALVTEIADLVNSVYAVAENGLWVEQATRTTRKEIAGYVDAQEITLARIGTRIVGCVRVQRLDLHTGEFGMLAAAPEERGRGIGRRLVSSAERQCFHSGCSTMQLELLVPRTWSHPSKEFLASWYARIGYTIARTGTIDESYSNLAPLLATECDFVSYHKDLGATCDITPAPSPPVVSTADRPG